MVLLRQPGTEGGEATGEGGGPGDGDLLTQLAAEIQFPDTEKLIEHGLEAMTAMRQSEILLGAK